MTKKYCFTICYSDYDYDDSMFCKYFYYDNLVELNEFLSHNLNYFNFDLHKNVKCVRITKNFGEFK